MLMIKVERPPVPPPSGRPPPPILPEGSARLPAPAPESRAECIHRLPDTHHVLPVLEAQCRDFYGSGPVGPRKADGKEAPHH